MNHDSKHNDFEYEKETFPKTPEHFKQLVVNQVAQEQQKNNVSPIKARKKWMPAKVAAVIIVCATMGTTGAYAGIKQYQARSQQYSGKFFRRRNIYCFRHDRFCGTSNDCIRRKRSCYYFF